LIQPEDMAPAEGEAMRAYGRVYPQQVGSSDAADIADRMAEIEEQRETDESADPEALDAE
jgi:hypothetical protein